MAEVECVTTDKRRHGALVRHRRRKHHDTLPPSDAANVELQRRTMMSPAPEVCTPQPLESHSTSAARTSTEQRPRLSSQCWGPEGWRTGRLPMMPRFVGSSLLELMTEWLDMAFYRLKGPKAHAISPVIDQGLTSVILLHPPKLPPGELLQVCIESYWNTVHPIFPFLNRAIVDSLYDSDTSSTQSSFSSHGQNSPREALKYLVLTAGLLATPADGSSRSLVSSYISYCNSLLGHIISHREIISVQTVLLFAMVLRCCDKVAWAWDILTMGVSMAQSIGINQTSSPQNGSSNQDTPEFQTWWCMYVFERILALELGRPSVIWDCELSRKLASPVQVDQECGSELIFRNALISLANTLHEMQERSARAWKREEWMPQSVEQAIEDKLRTGGELQILLSEWQDSLPPAFRPGSTSALSNGPQSAFLSYYYNLGVILVTRSTILVPKDELQAMVNKFAAGKAWRQRLLSAPTMVIEAARQTIKLFIALIDSGTPNFLKTMTSPLAAVYTLAVHIFQERSSLLIRSDFELMKVGIQITKEYYDRHEAAGNVDDILLDLQEYASRCLEAPALSLPDLFHLDTNALNLSDIPMRDTVSTFEIGSTWGPSALDWAGWDWNDLSHLFAHSE
ncbi:uncharacterized protein N7503_008080 [Penicillium pulvis]|uniref:uncharacterized protein n=1 Tax=Penicillium pulvis TaxID=1562058 RepID=UPI0025471881|nr:uncharacterized protein N7503_008080 [Penicillium pulvis]KAJ5792102.1 hypothetical protein N7503_008080 [Penicillium pulvis]